MTKQIEAQKIKEEELKLLYKACYMTNFHMPIHL